MRIFAGVSLHAGAAAGILLSRTSRRVNRSYFGLFEYSGSELSLHRFLSRRRCSSGDNAPSSSMSLAQGSHAAIQLDPNQPTKLSDMPPPPTTVGPTVPVVAEGPTSVTAAWICAVLEEPYLQQQNGTNKTIAHKIAAAPSWMAALALFSYSANMTSSVPPIRSLFRNNLTNVASFNIMSYRMIPVVNLSNQMRGSFRTDQNFYYSLAFCGEDITEGGTSIRNPDLNESVPSDQQRMARRDQVAYFRQMQASKDLALWFEGHLDSNYQAVDHILRQTAAEDAVPLEAAKHFVSSVLSADDQSDPKSLLHGGESERNQVVRGGDEVLPYSPKFPHVFTDACCAANVMAAAAVSGCWFESLQLLQAFEAMNNSPETNSYKGTPIEIINGALATCSSVATYEHENIGRKSRISPLQSIIALAPSAVSQAFFTPTSFSPLIHSSSKPKNTKDNTSSITSSHAWSYALSIFAYYFLDFAGTNNEGKKRRVVQTQKKYSFCKRIPDATSVSFALRALAAAPHRRAAGKSMMEYKWLMALKLWNGIAQVVPQSVVGKKPFYCGDKATAAAVDASLGLALRCGRWEGAVSILTQCAINGQASHGRGPVPIVPSADCVFLSAAAALEARAWHIHNVLIHRYTLIADVTVDIEANGPMGDLARYCPTDDIKIATLEVYALAAQKASVNGVKSKKVKASPKRMKHDRRSRGRDRAFSLIANCCDILCCDGSVTLTRRHGKVIALLASAVRRDDHHKILLSPDGGTKNMVIQREIFEKRINRAIYVMNAGL